MICRQMSRSFVIKIFANVAGDTLCAIKKRVPKAFLEEKVVLDLELT